MISSHKPYSCQKSKKINQIYDLNYKKYNGRNPLYDRDQKDRTFNPIPTGSCHMTLMYGLIPPMAGRNRVKDV